MNFDVTVNGRPWKIAIEETTPPGGFDVVIKGRRRTVEAVWIDAETLSLIERGPHAIVHEVGIDRTQAGQMCVVIRGKSFLVVAEKRGRVPFSQEAGTKKAPDPFSRTTGPQNVVAPMPGRVVRVLVAPGDKVAAGQGLVVMEAMKMENELRSPKDGVVREVAVVEGAAIDTGTVVVVVD